MKNKFICPLPWVSLSIGVNNKRRLCCHETRSQSQLNQSEIDQIKYYMEKGAIPLDCKKCASLEALNISSPREQYLMEFPSSDRLQYLDLVINNDCNLECLMCSPAYSSRLNKIYKELSPKEVMPPWKINFEDLQKYDLSEVKVLNIIGGEPLNSKDAFDIISYCLKKSNLDKLRIVTNLTKLPDYWRDIFNKVEKVDLIVSIDATGKLYEFIRYPAKFDAVIANLKKLKSWNLDNLSLRQHVVLMNINFQHLNEIITFHEEHFSTTQNRLPIFVEISSPQVLHPRVLTQGQWEKGKLEVLGRLDILEKTYGYRKEFSDFKKLLSKIEDTDLKHLYVDYRIYLQKIQKGHTSLNY